MADGNRLFWPSLYARLVPHVYASDAELDAAERRDEPTGSDRHFLTDFATLQHHIRTDLIALLNATSLESELMAGKEPPVREGQGNFVVMAHEQLPFSDYPLVRRSVINYGLPSMIGRAVFRLRLPELQEELREAILAYEPRLRPESLTVDITEEMDEERIKAEGPLRFDIVAEVRGTEARMQLRINSVWDLEKISSEVEPRT